jgi:phosphohistidine phosphatase
MRVLFVRHAAAMDRTEFSGPDLLRPLTDDGRTRAKAAFRTLARLCDPPELIISSKAVRARETADILHDCLGKAPVVETDLLNPGANYKHFKKALADLAGKHEYIAVVGHEPDFSTVVGLVCCDGMLRIDVKKASCIEVDLNRSLAKGELKAVYPPGALIALGK